MDADKLAKLDRQLSLMAASNDEGVRALLPTMQDYFYSTLASLDTDLSMADLRYVKPGEISNYFDRRARAGGGRDTLVTDMLEELKQPTAQSEIQRELGEDISGNANALDAQAQSIQDAQDANTIALENSQRALGRSEIFSGRNTVDAPGIAAELQGLGQDTSLLNSDPQVEVSSAPITAVRNNFRDRARSNDIVRREQNQNINQLESQADFVRSFERNINATRKTIERALLEGLSRSRDTKEGADPNG